MCARVPVFSISPHSRELKGEMGETCSCFTPHTSLTSLHGTHLNPDTTQDRIGQNTKKLQKAVRSASPACTKKVPSKCLLFILLETENAGRRGDGGRLELESIAKNKRRLSLSVCLSLLLLCSPFHLPVFKARANQRVCSSRAESDSVSTVTLSPKH